MGSFARSLPRIGLGLVFLAAGFLKGADPAEFVRQVEGYGIVSGEAATAVAYTLIPLELVLGVALLVGYRVRAVAGATNLLLLLFMGVTAYAWSQGKTEGCGCFGSLASRTPGQVLLEDLGFLSLGVMALSLGRSQTGRARWRGIVVACGLVGAILLPLAAYALPLDPLVTVLRVGRRVEDLPLRESPVDLSRGDHLVAVLDLEGEESGRVVPRLNAYQKRAGAPRVTAFYGGEVDAKTVFCFNYDPNFEVVAVPRGELKRLYRTLPRFFRIQEGKVARIWDTWPPDVEELK